MDRDPDVGTVRERNGEAGADVFGDGLTRREAAREIGMLIEVRILQRCQGVVEQRQSLTDVEDDGMLVELGPVNVTSTARVAPWRDCAGPKNSCGRLWAIMTWSLTLRLNIQDPSS